MMMGVLLDDPQACMLCYLRCLVNVVINHGGSVPRCEGHSTNPSSLLIQCHLQAQTSFASQEMASTENAE